MVCRLQCLLWFFFFSSRRRHTRCALVTEFRRVLFRSSPWIDSSIRIRPAASLKPSDRSIFEAKLQPRTETFIIFVGRIAVAVLVPSHGGDREVTVQQIFRLDIAAPYPLGLIRSEEHTSELQSLMRISYAVFCLKKK